MVVIIPLLFSFSLITRYSRQMFQGPSREILHCTSCYLGRNQQKQEQEQEQENQEEQEKLEVQEACGRAAGRAFPLTVVGFFLTPRTWGARVSLSKEQMELWVEDNVTTSSSPVSSTHVKDQHPKQGKTSKERTHANKVKREEEEEQVDLEGGLEACQTTMVVQNQVASVDEVEGSRWGRKSGRRAHITLGCAEGARPVQAGKDLENILDELDLEADEKSGTEVGEEGRLYVAGEAIYLELNQPITFTSLFTGSY